MQSVEVSCDFYEARPHIARCAAGETKQRRGRRTGKTRRGEDGSDANKTDEKVTEGREVRKEGRKGGRRGEDESGQAQREQ